MSNRTWFHMAKGQTFFEYKEALIIKSVTRSTTILLSSQTSIDLTTSGILSWNLVIYEFARVLVGQDNNRCFSWSFKYVLNVRSSSLSYMIISRYFTVTTKILKICFNYYIVDSSSLWHCVPNRNQFNPDPEFLQGFSIQDFCHKYIIWSWDWNCQNCSPFFIL